MPPASAFKPAKAAKSEAPRWWKASFKAAKTPAPLYFEALGLTKGQIYINGRHLGRYYTGGVDGKPIPGQTRYYIPSSWIRQGAENDIILFEEHGHAPTKAKLVYDADKTPLTVSAPGSPAGSPTVA
jgi:beta-galactosidase